MVLFLAASALVWGQGPGPGPGPGHREGKWWNNSEMVQRLGLTAEQQKKMDDVLQQSRLRLIDLNASLEKEEVVMEGLMRGAQLDDAKILPEVDRIAQARAELEKANARLMLGLRHVLTPEQWEKLNSNEGPRPRREGPGHGGPPVAAPPPHPFPGGPGPRGPGEE